MSKRCIYVLEKTEDKFEINDKDIEDRLILMWWSWPQRSLYTQYLIFWNQSLRKTELSTPQFHKARRVQIREESQLPVGQIRVSLISKCQHDRRYIISESIFVGVMTKKGCIWPDLALERRMRCKRWPPKRRVTRGSDGSHLGNNLYVMSVKPADDVQRGPNHFPAAA